MPIAWLNYLDVLLVEDALIMHKIIDVQEHVAKFECAYIEAIEDGMYSLMYLVK